MDYMGKQYLLLNSGLTDEKLNLSGWKLTTLIPLDTVYQSTTDIRQASIFACLICILVAVPLLALFSRTITKRLEYLVEKMDDIRRGNYNVSVVVHGNDEISRLGDKFNDMLRTLDLLTKEEMEAKLKEEQLENARKEARIFALERQINPHYLFNTLECIRMSLVLKGDRETANLVQIFAKSYREMIDESEQSDTLRDELSFIRDYFTIHDFCYGGKIRLKIDVPEDLLSFRIPKFLLQPLIENAIYHGLELKENGGEVCLIIRKEDGNMVFCVKDNGVGMSDEELKTLLASLHSSKSVRKNCAIRNIAERLTLIYGRRASLTIQSQLNVGTEVLVTLPADGMKVEKLCIKS